MIEWAKICSGISVSKQQTKYVIRLMDWHFSQWIASSNHDWCFIWKSSVIDSIHRFLDSDAFQHPQISCDYHAKLYQSSPEYAFNLYLRAQFIRRMVFPLNCKYKSRTTITIILINVNVYCLIDIETICAKSFSSLCTIWFKCF